MEAGSADQDETVKLLYQTVGTARRAGRAWAQPPALPALGNTEDEAQGAVRTQQAPDTHRQRVQLTPHTREPEVAGPRGRHEDPVRDLQGLSHWADRWADPRSLATQPAPSGPGSRDGVLPGVRLCPNLPSRGKKAAQPSQGQSGSSSAPRSCECRQNLLRGDKDVPTCCLHLGTSVHWAEKGS